MTYPDAVRYLMSLLGDIRGSDFGLHRMEALLARLGNPHRAYRVVHVAGTNGKGSTAAMIEAGLRAAGHSTGLYTSPHLMRFNERLKINGSDGSDELFASAVAEVRAANEWLAAKKGRQGHPTFFESVTAAAFCGFRQAGVAWGIIEVGLGGRLDATNVVTPEVAVITPIAFDHEAFLGKSAASIAAEKAGILKPGCKAVFASQSERAEEVLTARAAELGVPVARTGIDWRAENLSDEQGRYRFTARRSNGPGFEVRLALAGEHQVENALAAAAALDALDVPAAAIAAGLASVAWPGRLQSFGSRPEILLDAAHNPAGARVLASFLQKHRRGRRIHLIYGASRDKAIDEVAGLLFPCAGRVILTRANVARSASPETLLSIADHHHDQIVVETALARAMERAQREAGPEDLIVIAGSVFLVGEALGLLQSVESLPV
ncbi:MAG: folylpolyglutamate synthase/dihydrofolate synthase family protein [Bryobacterales bacterium]